MRTGVIVSLVKKKGMNAWDLVGRIENMHCAVCGRASKAMLWATED